MPALSVRDGRFDSREPYRILRSVLDAPLNPNIQTKFNVSTNIFLDSFCLVFAYVLYI